MHFDRMLAELFQEEDRARDMAHKLAETVYASAQQSQTASTGATGGNGAGTSDDETVEDADYEVIDEEQEAPKA